MKADDGNSTGQQPLHARPAEDGPVHVHENGQQQWSRGRVTETARRTITHHASPSTGTSTSNSTSSARHLHRLVETPDERLIHKLQADAAAASNRRVTAEAQRRLPKSPVPYRPSGVYSTTPTHGSRESTGMPAVETPDDRLLRKLQADSGGTVQQQESTSNTTPRNTPTPTHDRGESTGMPAVETPDDRLLRKLQADSGGTVQQQESTSNTTPRNTPTTTTTRAQNHHHSNNKSSERKRVEPCEVEQHEATEPGSPGRGQRVGAVAVPGPDAAAYSDSSPGGSSSRFNDSELETVVDTNAAVIAPPYPTSTSVARIGAVAVAGPDAVLYDEYGRPSRYNEYELDTLYSGSRDDTANAVTTRRGGPYAPHDVELGESGEHARETKDGGLGTGFTCGMLHSRRGKCILIGTLVIFVMVGAACGIAAAATSFGGNGEEPPGDNMNKPGNDDFTVKDENPIIIPTNPTDSDLSPPPQCRPQELEYSVRNHGQRSFGTSVTIDKDRAFVGADSDSMGSGIVYAYNRDATSSSSSSPSTWTVEEEPILPLKNFQNNQFGRSVSAAGADTLAVGALQRSEKGRLEGCVYIFTESNEAGTEKGWKQQETIVSPRADHSFGSSISLYLAKEGANSTTNLVLLAGEPKSGNGSEDQQFDGPRPGAAYIYRRLIDDTTWTQEALLQPREEDRPKDGDDFGYAVHLDGSYAAVSSKGRGGSGSFYGGSVYVYRLEAGGDLAHIITLVPEDNAGNGSFGTSISILDSDAFGTYIAVGADRDKVGGMLSSGSVYLYRLDESTSAWGQEEKIRPKDGAASKRFGASVAFSSDGTLVVGAPGDDAHGDNSGAVYTFQRGDNTATGNKWIQKYKQHADGASENDMFGSSVDTDGETAVIGAFGGNTIAHRSGEVYAMDICQT